MIKFEIDAPNLKDFEISGDIMAISAELAVLPKLIYQELSKTQPEAAALFKFITQKGMGNEDSPVWNNNEPIFNGAIQDNGTGGGILIDTA